MRRFLTLCLLMFLPLQFSWAAVASYCGHEAGPKTEHVGHHAHEHGAAAGVTAEPAGDANATSDSSADHSAGKTPGASDLDCAQCHGCCSGMPGADVALLPDAVDVPPGAGAAHAAALPAAARPERPQWARLA